MLKSLFKYQEYERVDVNGSRHYDINGTYIPSVTTILSASSDKSFLEDWKNRVGEAEAEKIVSQSSNTGSSLHDNLERLIKYGDTNYQGNIMAKMMTQKMVSNGFKNIDYFVGSEVMLYNGILYAGTSDAICVINGRLTVIDFKNSRSMKTEEMITDYFLQAIAYIEAHNTMYNTDIVDAVIMMVTQDGKYKEFYINKSNYRKYSDLWLRSLEMYYEQVL